jgi:hypothetical protein
MSTLQGRKVLITHAGDGLGFAIAIALGQRGADLVIHDASLAVAGAAAERLKLAISDVNVSAVSSDLGTEAGRQTLTESVGRIDIFVSDSVGETAIDFAQVAQPRDEARHEASSRQGQTLAGTFSRSMGRQGWGRIFLLTSAHPPSSFLTLDSDDYSASLVPYTLASGADVDAFLIPVATLILEPVADVMKSEVMRTGRSLAEVADQFERDHRPANIQRAAREISLLAQRVTDACLG